MYLKSKNIFDNKDLTGDGIGYKRPKNIKII